MPILGKGRFDDPSGIIPGDIVIQGNLTVEKDVIYQGSETVSGDETITGELAVGGDITLDTLGKSLKVKAGANGKAGTVTVNGATPVSVATTAFVAGSVVLFSLKTVGGTVGQLPHLVTATPATGFDVAATAGDTSVYNWVIIDTY